MVQQCNTAKSGGKRSASDPGPGVNREGSPVFLGWDKPCARLIAEWLWQDPELLRRRLVVVPTRESGRRLRELLAELSLVSGVGAVLGPRVATPEDFFRPTEIIPDSVLWAGWVKALQQTTDDDVRHLFPKGLRRKDEAWCFGVARQIEEARDLLAAANLRFDTVESGLPEEGERWSELAALEKRAKTSWSGWGYEDPVQAKIREAERPAVVGGVHEIVVAAVPDPTWLAIQAWNAVARQGLKVTVLICAPEDLAEHFDVWGRPEPEFWADRDHFSTPEPGNIYVAADASGLAEAVVRSCAGRANTETAVGVCGSAFLPAVARRLERAGWPSYDPQGNLLPRDGWPALLDAIAGAIEKPQDYVPLARLVRHPMVWHSWLQAAGARSALSALDEWEAKECPCVARRAIELLAGSERESLKACSAMLQKTQSLVETGQKSFATLQKQILEWAAWDEDVRARISEEVAAWPKLKGVSTSSLLRFLSAAVMSVRRPADHPRKALPLQGWLELLFEPAPQLVLAALHEGAVPEAPAPNPLITDVLREKLHFRDRRSRLARDIFLYSAMLHGRARAGSVTIVTAQIDPTGEPCRPSRVLLQAGANHLPFRVARLMSERADIPPLATPAWSRGRWLLHPKTDTPRNKTWEHLSPSALRMYLACPTRFYFSRVLGWELFARFDQELDAMQFGSLFHDVFKAWGDDARARTETNPQKLAAVWHGLLEDLVRERFGTDLPPLLRLQTMSARERLAALANVQAAQCLEGWNIVAVEKPYNHLRLAGLPVEMRVDRIDRHDDGRIRVIDYKTSKKGLAPRQTHLSFWREDVFPAPLAELVEMKGRFYCWTDLQLPLYVLAVQQEMGLKEPPSGWYAVVPEAVSETGFVEFEDLADLLDNARAWAEAAASSILEGVFWPPAPAPAYDDFAAIAPEGLEKALGAGWADFLSGGPLR